MRGRKAATLAVLVLALAPALPGARPAAAQQPPAAGFGDLYAEYRRDGFLFGCTHRDEDLRSALAAIPADIRAYDPGFADALNAALEQRAAGCTGALSSPFPQSPASTAGTAIAQDGSPGPANRRFQTPTPAPERVETAMPAALVALTALLAAALLAAAWLALASYLGRDPAQPLRAAAGPLRRAGVWLGDCLWTLRNRLGP